MAELNHASREHALLSASAAARWMACTPSALLEDEYPDKQTEYSKEGTRAHEIAEECLRRYLEGKRRPSYKGDDLRIFEEVDPYIESVKGSYEVAKLHHPDAVLFLETRLDFSKYVPDGFGTGDAIIIAGDSLEVIDLKFGKGVPVEAANNSQLRLYGVGAYLAFEDLYDFSYVQMRIIQPRLHKSSVEVLEPRELLLWAKNECAPRAQLAIKGEGELVSGDHCRFCKHQADCTKLIQETAEVLAANNEALTEMVQMVQVLDQAPTIRKFLDAVEAKAMEMLLNGEEVPGYKVVEGISKRKYTSEEAVVDKLKAEGYAEGLIYEKKVYGITAMQKNLGKKLFDELLGNCIYKPQGKPTLVADSDPRPPYSSAADDFKGIEVEA